MKWGTTDFEKEEVVRPGILLTSHLIYVYSFLRFTIIF